MNESVKSSIFISYSRQDQAYVRKLINAFESKGLSVWLDERIDYGTAWQKVIEDHLRACQVFVLVMTPHSLESHWVQCELSLALELKKPVFPLLLEGERWFSVARIQIVDVRSGALPPERFFKKVSTSVVRVEVKKVAISEPIDTTDKILADTSLIGKELSVPFAAEDEPVALRRELEELRAQQSEPQRLLIDARYADLERYLKNKEWEAADEETYRLMIAEVGKEEGQWFKREDLLNFPCEPLRVINGLWVTHSGGRFGFSVQKDLYLKCGGIADGKHYEGAWKKFCQQNGWMKSNELSNVRYDTSSPLGHIPVCSSLEVYWGSVIGGRREGEVLEVLFSRLQTCKL
ncbi:MAG: GUN4 domain-containing protein [Cyanobacteria bacterium P01_D01_bin.1]